MDTYLLPLGLIDAGPAHGWHFSGGVLEAAPISCFSLHILVVNIGPFPRVGPPQISREMLCAKVPL